MPTGHKLTHEQFLAKAVAIHGNRYDYSRAAYVKSSLPVEIICPKHGVFEQVPNGHLAGQGCPVCGRARATQRVTSDISEFLEKAHAKHGAAYDYSQVIYVGSKAKVKIKCPTHGEFLQSPTRHLNSKGCPKCSGHGRYTNADFVERARAIHGDKYSYSHSVLVGSITDKVIIICPQHGSFIMSPSSHIHQQAGCYECGRIKKSQDLIADVNTFIAAARAKHGDKYDYSQVNYRGSAKKVTIICTQHGSFNQSASSHIHQGSGCPTCNQEWRREQNCIHWTEKAKGKAATLYFVRLFNSKESFYKVGVTFHSVKKRFSRSNMPGYKYEVLALHKSENSYRVHEWEQSILETFSYLRYKPSTHFVGASECFSSADEILAIFPL